MSKGPPTIICSTHFLFCIFCSADLLHLHLWSPPPNVQGCSNNFCSTDFCCAVFVLHFCSAEPFASTPVVTTTQSPRVLQQFLFHWFLFCSFHSAFLFCWPFCTYTYSHHHPMSKALQSIFVLLFLFCIFVLLTFLHLHLWSPPPNIQGSFKQFLFHWLFVLHFCSTDLFQLASAVPATTCPRDLQQFLSCYDTFAQSPWIFILLFLFLIFVLLTFLY